MLFFTLPTVSLHHGKELGHVAIDPAIFFPGLDYDSSNEPNNTFPVNFRQGSPSKASITLAPNTWAGTAASEPPNLPTAVRLKCYRYMQAKLYGV